mgnify:CR=1 FL=1
MVLNILAANTKKLLKSIIIRFAGSMALIHPILISTVLIFTLKLTGKMTGEKKDHPRKTVRIRL